MADGKIPMVKMEKEKADRIDLIDLLVNEWRRADCPQRFNVTVSGKSGDANVPLFSAFLTISDILKSDIIDNYKLKHNGSISVLHAGSGQQIGYDVILVLVHKVYGTYLQITN